MNNNIEINANNINVGNISTNNEQNVTVIPLDEYVRTEFNLNNNIKRSIPFITKYEYAKLMGIRVTQLTTGAPSTINTDGYTSYYDIARRELVEGKLPLIIVRSLPNNDVEYWKIEEFKNLNNLVLNNF